MAFTLWLTILLLDIPPQIESDYCYQLQSVNRFWQGHGLTALLPFAPGQSWTYRGDFAFLTQWPCGYPLLLIGVMGLTGLSLMSSIAAINAFAVATLAVGWCCFARKSIESGWLAFPAGVAAALSGMTPGSLVNPQTDILVAAAIPWILIFALEARRRNDSWKLAFTLGVVCGMLFWIRYAAVFVGGAVAVFLLFDLCRRVRSTCLASEQVIGRKAFLCFAAFAFALAVPICTLIVINSVLAPTSSVQQQLNLGQHAILAFEPGLMLSAWNNLTDWTYYAHRSEAAFLNSAGTFVLLVLGVTVVGLRRPACGIQHRQAFVVLALLVATLLAELVAATTIFGEKFNYVGLERYYLPVRPALVLMLVIPFASIRVLPLKMALITILVLMIHWSLQMDGHRALMRWSHHRIERTPSGAWAQVFSPEAPSLYQAMRRQAAADAVFISNFHDYLSLETGLPVYPLPDSPNQMEEWINTIRLDRDTPNTRVYFVLDRNIRWREYFWPTTQALRETFDLTPVLDEPESGWLILEWQADRPEPS